MVDIKPIDTMNRPFYVRPETAKRLFEAPEFRTLIKTTFSGIAERHGLEEGEEWKIFEILGAGSVENMIDEMDEIGVEKVFMDQIIQWSREESKVLRAMDIEELAELVEESNGRIVPGVGYNPYRIRESLNRIERAVKEFNFAYVWFHPMTFNIKPTDQKCYPLYSKCVELDLPVSYQTGHSAEPLPSEPGRPMYADEVAMDFPDLTLILTHTGWPWFDEWCSMLWRHPNVYGNIGAFYPSFLPDRQVDFIDSSRIRDKVLWATNGLNMTRCLNEFKELGLREQTQKRVLRENALEVFDI
jgi:predicted TIM-barrel fold metal-dependent hydrolase